MLEAKKTAAEHDHSLMAMGASTDEEKIAIVKCQTAYNLSLAGRYDESIQVIDEAKRIAPRFAPIYRVQALIESEEGHIDKANSLMEEATNNEPINGELWFIWGNINRKNRRFDKAYDCYKRALELSPHDPMYLSTYALSLRDHGRYSEADEYFTKALELKQTSNRHQIINKAGKAENLRRWAQVYSRDKNYLSAHIKLLAAKKEITSALAIDPLDFKLKLLYKQVLLEIANHLAIREGITYARSAFEECITIALDSQGIMRFKDKEFAGKAYYYFSEHLFRDSPDESKILLLKGLIIMPKESKIYPKLVRLNDRFNEVTLNTRIKSGIVTFFKTNARYGFIKDDDGKDYFFHITGFTSFLDNATITNLQNRRVMFDISKEESTAEKQQQKAINIILEPEKDEAIS